ncbi:MAG: helix-turn-helix transcriptional regulator [Chloroflexi bacterium]|nr:helix-turn-helix transcriptional regulator [Chloroflexota bacterium]
MASDRDVLRRRGAQAGFTMRAYRRAYVAENGKRGLTQEELLQRMASVDDEYAERFSHATVSRWESGATRPSLRRMRAFGGALHLTRDEVAGLILLAGLAPDFQAAWNLAASDEGALDASQPVGGHWEPDPVAADAPETQIPRNGSAPLRSVVRFVLSRCLPLGVAIVAGGFALSPLNWDGSRIPAMYVGLMTGLVVAQGLLVPDRGAGLRELFWVSLFVLLSTPLLQFAPLQMDHYGLYTLGDFAGSHWPYTLALLVNLGVASVAGVMFDLLQARQASRRGGGSRALGRAVSSVLPPVVLVYAVLVVISNESIWIQYAVLMPVLGGMFTTLVVLSDPSINPSREDRQFLLWVTMAFAIVAGSMGMAAIFTVYASPELPTILPDHNLLSSWEIDFSELGYTREEALDRLNVGYVWHATLTFAYMVFVLGGNLIARMYRLEGWNATKPDADVPTA